MMCAKLSKYLKIYYIFQDRLHSTFVAMLYVSCSKYLQKIQ